MLPLLALKVHGGAAQAEPYPCELRPFRPGEVHLPTVQLLGDGSTNKQTTIRLKSNPFKVKNK
jgi:hypothetical protein